MTQPDQTPPAVAAASQFAADPGNQLIQPCPTILTVTVAEPQKLGVLTWRTTSATLTVIGDADTLDRWITQLQQLRANLGSGLIIPNVITQLPRMNGHHP